MAAPQKKKRLVFLINPGAGQRAAARVKSAAPGIFNPAQWNLDFVDLAHWRQTFPTAQKAAKNGAFAVVAVGGDGTINLVALALAGTKCRLGIVPAGTGNGLARALGLPLDAEGACRVLAQGKERSIDYGSMDKDRGFANVLGVGWDAWIATKANELRSLNRLSGFLRYLVAGFLTLPKTAAQDLELVLDGKKLRGRFLVVVVANSPQYGFGCTVAPMARLDDGKLNVVCVPPIGPITFARNLTRLFTRKPLLGASFYEVKKAVIRSAKGLPLAVHVDGEPGGVTPATINVRRRALKVLVP
jgi:diacylglycerol kinase (ATP)